MGRIFGLLVLALVGLVLLHVGCEGETKASWGSLSKSKVPSDTQTSREQFPVKAGELVYFASTDGSEVGEFEVSREGLSGRWFATNTFRTAYVSYSFSTGNKVEKSSTLKCSTEGLEDTSLVVSGLTAKQLRHDKDGKELSKRSYVVLARKPACLKAHDGETK